MRPELPKYIFKHEMPVQIRFSDIDILGHVNNAVYLNYFDMAKARYFEAVHQSTADWGRYDVVVANVNIDFFSPVFLQDNIVIKTKVIRMGVKSFDMVQQLEDVQTGTIKTMSRSVVVGFDVPTNSSKALSEEWKERIRSFEGDPSM